MEQEKSLCECPGCGSEDVCVPDTTCTDCGEWSMIPVEDHDATLP
jgi:hypothetical protein